MIVVVVGVTGVFNFLKNESGLDAELPVYDCESVKQWEEGIKKGLSPYERNGRPANNKHEKEACLGGTNV